MTDIILCGANGKMGHVLANSIAKSCDCRVVAGIDLNTESYADFPIFARPENCAAEADVLIDFSHPSSLAGVLRYVTEHRMPAVIATTGLSESDVLAIRKAAESVPIFFSANMSLGVALLAELAKRAASVLGENYDVEIIEKHHNRKIDAPSGTALMLADSVREGLPYEPQYTYDRHSVRAPRNEREIGFSSVRGGTIVGEHEILFAGHDEVITLSHSAASKELFATGALSAAKFLPHKPAGLYTMTDLIREI